MSQLESFASIYQRASDRKGGDKCLESLLSGSLTEDEIGQYKDAELLSEMSKKVFQSGFIWRIVENKWPAYQEAFFNFDPHKVLMLSPEQLQERASDSNLIRHMKKTMAIYDNALMTHDIAREHGSLAEYIGNWPTEEITQLWQCLNAVALGSGVTPDLTFCER